MNSLNVPKFSDLIRPDRVHRALYTDPMLFELEMDRLFGRAWLVLGHESQVKAPGDFFTARMARQPVLVGRDDSSAIRVRSNFILVEFRADRQFIYGGACEHCLVRAGAGYKIAAKRVDLVNSEGVLDGISILL